MPDPTAVAVRFTTRAGAKHAGLSATRRPDAGANEAWALGPAPFRVAPGDTFRLMGARDKRARTVLTAVAAVGGGTTLTCSVA